ncbi:MAG TPA: hypothetical protein VF363_07235 [Candidatus Eisenbacteria bacterium]
MRRPCRRSCTGSSATPRRVWLVSLLLLPILATPAAPAGAQTLKLRSLRVFASDVVGPWVTYRVRTRSGRSAVREFTQRVAIVSREDRGGRPAYWVELKTVDAASGTRIERGLFASAADPDSANGDAGDSASAEGPAPLHLVRYQVLTPGGKLYEYPLESASRPRAEGEVSSFELFEFDPTVKPERSFLGPDTLRIGRRVVPAVMEKVVRVGTDNWPTFDDTTSVYRLRIAQTLWRNAAVPITGIARSVFRVTTVKVAEHPDSVHVDRFVRPDTTATPAGGIAPADTTLEGPSRGDGRVLAFTELLLQDLGADAVPEATQTPEPAPANEPRQPGFIR